MYSLSCQWCVDKVPVNTFSVICCSLLIAICNLKVTISVLKPLNIETKRDVGTSFQQVSVLCSPSGIGMQTPFVLFMNYNQPSTTTFCFPPKVHETLMGFTVFRLYATGRRNQPGPNDHKVLPWRFLLHYAIMRHGKSRHTRIELG